MSTDYFASKRLQDEQNADSLTVAELEAVLLRHRAVRKCAVVNFRGEGEATAFVAYVVADYEANLVAPGISETERRVSATPMFQLANGQSIYHINQRETEFLYQEIFVEKSYLSKGIVIQNGACVWDLGANIGLFSIFAARAAKDVSIYAFEPIPEIFEVLRQNVELWNLNAKLFPLGVSSEGGSRDFIYYPRLSIMSSSNARANREREVLARFLRNRFGSQIPYENERARTSEDLARYLLEGKPRRCSCTRLSDVIREHEVERIDLLKIDIEGGELAVLEDISRDDWKKIEQLVVETGAQNGEVTRLVKLLIQRGYHVTTGRERLLAGTGLLNVYARRPGENRGDLCSRNCDGYRSTRRPAHAVLLGDLYRHVNAAVAAKSLRLSIQIVDLLPNVDQNDAIRYSTASGGPRSLFVAARNSVERELMSIWESVLQERSIGVYDDFYELGGDSFLESKVLSMVHDSLGVNVNSISMRETFTISSYATRVETLRRWQFEHCRSMKSGGAEVVNLSFAQELLLKWREAQGDLRCRNRVLSLRVKGNLDLSALNRSVGHLLRRQAVLDSYLSKVEGRWAFVKANRDHGWIVEVTEMDAFGLDLEFLISSESAKEFDLGKAPLIRIKVFRVAHGEHALVITVPELTCDEKSLLTIQQELSLLYNCEINGNGHPEDLETHFADFTRWQRDCVERGASEDRLQYWRGRIAGCKQLSLPERRSEAAPAQEGNIRCFEVPLGICNRVNAIAEKECVPVSTVLLTAFQILLYRYTGERDISIVVMRDGRRSLGLQGLVGNFLRLGIARISLAGYDTGRRLLQRTRQACLEVFTDEAGVLDKLLAELDPENDDCFLPMNIGFAMDSCSDSGSESDAVFHRRNQEAITAARFHLELRFLRRGELLEGQFVFRQDLFEGAMIEGMIRHYLNLLEGMACDLDLRLFNFEIMPPEERHRVVTECNRTQIEYPTHKCLHELVSEQAARTPEAVALICEGNEINYRDLDERSNDLAERLRVLGVVPESLVVLYMNRGINMIVGVLSILKAGGAYVPLDLDYPPDGLHALLEEVKPLAIIGEQGISEALNGCTAAIVYADGTPSSAVSKRKPACRVVGARNLAYVIHTSGSTGKPKGVLMEHQAVMNRLIWMARHYRLGSNDVFLQKTRHTFDVSVWELLLPLIIGAKIVLLPKNAEREPEELAKAIEHYRVSVIHFVPSMLRAFLDWLEDGRSFKGLRLCFCSGETLGSDVASNFFKRFGDNTELHNLYGPTEAAIDVTFHRVWRSDATIPIGSPVANTEIYVLDENFCVVPINVPGELHIGGVQLARGYLNAPELTAAKFMADPFAERGGGRLYRTGDLVRRLASGEIEFLGRIDRQLKIRGFRVEPGEIESAIIRLKTVRQCAVLGQKQADGRTLVVAYIVPADGNLTEDSIRSALRLRLPDFMIPSVFVFMERLPLTTGGKIDLRSLPSLKHGPTDLGKYYVAPRTSTESTVARLFSEVLKIDRVGVRDEFLKCGGDSLMAIQLASRIRHLLRKKISADAVLRCQTIEALSSLLDRLPKEEFGTPDLAANQNVCPLEQVLPSIAQQQVMFLNDLVPESLAYQSQSLLVFKGELDTAALRKALAHLVAEHEIYRTTFHRAEGSFIQKVHEQGIVDLSDVDVSGGTAGEVEARLGQLIYDEVRKRIDSARLPLIRWILVRAHQRKHVLLQIENHLVHDGWSSRILLRDLAKRYNAFKRGVSPGLDTARYQFSDYCRWQQEWLNSEETRRCMFFWRQYLFEAPQILQLPFDSSKENDLVSSGNQVRKRLDKALLMKLRSSANELRVSLFHIMFAMFGVVIHRMTNQSDFLVGTAIANRSALRWEEVIGMFVNVIPIRFRVSEELPLQELVKQIGKEMSLVQEASELPFPLIVKEVADRGGSKVSPLVQVTFNIHHALTKKVEFEGLSTEVVEGIGNGSAKFDLNVTAILEADEDAEIIWEYNTRVWEETTIERIAKRYEQALKSLAHALEEAPHTPLGKLDVLPPSERQLLLSTWNETETLYSEGRCIHELFEEQVQKSPEAVAVVLGEQSLSYAELNAQANRLAHYLIELGVIPDSRVGICVERSLEMVVGLIAILKAGGAYVPLDPSYPAQRLAYVLEDAKPVLLLADATGRKALGEVAIANLRVLDINTTQRAWANLSIDSPGPDVLGLTASNLAYVIYTSGSTGSPKGVMVEHRQLSWLFESTQPYYEFDSKDIWCLFHSIGFDFSVWELWGALRYGGRLIITRRDIARSAQEFYRVVCDYGVTVLNQTPSAFKAFIDAQSQSQLQHRLRYVIFGGEALETSILKPWYIGHPHGQPQLVNMYGITETTVHVTYRALQAADTTKTGSPIGQPLPGQKIYLLNGHREPVPLGAVGELYIGGAGVARGYLNRPELTAERFLEDPFSAKSDERMYRTGDLARYLPDGNLEFLGRNDEQVKIRGFRIEPGEIEARLTEHPAVRQAKVIVREDNPEEKRLVAYVIPTEEQPEDLAGLLRRYISAQLPAYMVPAAFVRLEAMPLTPNGKLDRKALPAPEGGAYARQAYEAPQGEVETVLAELWQELLGVERISRHDNFFELGGHSLLAVQLMERLRRLGLNAEVRSLFRTPSLGELAATLGSHQEAPVPVNTISAQSMSITPEMLPLIELSRSDIDRIVQQVPGGVSNIQDIYALSPLQDGILFHHLLANGGDPYLVIVQMAFRRRSLLDRYLGAVQQVVDRHDILRTSFIWEQLSSPAQVVWRHAPLSITEVELDPQGGPGTEQLARRFDPRNYRLDLKQAPLLRFVVAQEPTSGRWLLLQLLHHLIGDHSTLAIQHQEVQTILQGRGHTLAAPQPFRNLIAQARLGVSDEEHEQFFTEMLGNIEEPTTPFGLRDVHRDGSEMTEARRMFSPELNQRLRAQARRLRVSLASLCHLAWGQVVARSSGRETVVFGTVLFGRMHAGAGADRAMGLFINTLPLRLELDQTGVEQSLRRTHERLAQLLGHEHCSLATAQRCSRVPPPAPVFSALLNYRYNRLPQRDNASPLSEMEYLGGKERTNYPLTLAVDDFGHALGVTAQVLEPIHAQRVCGYMQQALESLAQALEQAPYMPVRELEVMPPSERELLLSTWNETEAPYPEDRCIHELFEEHARRSPNATAVVSGEESLSYAELNAQANRLAHYLVELGVKPESRVAICVKRSLEMVVGLIAILKAGGAYVPLDPSYPAQRLSYLLKDAKPVLLLGDAKGRRALGEAGVTDLRVVDIDTPYPGWARLPDVNLGSRVLDLTPSNLAYLMYTSGSTGVPKGVLIEHRSVSNLINCVQKQWGFSCNDRILQFASISFDGSVEEIFGALLSGATLVLCQTWLSDAFEFWRACEKLGLTVVALPTHFLELLVTDLSTVIPPAIRLVIVGGETLNQKTSLSWLQRRGNRSRLWNTYGPTECTIEATIGQISEDQPLHIGKPVSNTRIYLLDAHGLPVPLGAVGEIYIGGAGVARGYLNQSELTAERFLEDPFSAKAGERMYRTGDLARYLPDGTLEFLGRNDEQVKIRGFRIEPGEIEASLAEHPIVREAKIVVREDVPGDKYLVAYVVTSEMAVTEDPATVLRTYLRASLPKYMLPAAFVRVEAFPVTQNGKLDRKALPAPKA